LEEFLDEVVSCQPKSAAIWLKNYSPTLKVIYCFQLLFGTDVADGSTLLHRVHNAVWNFVAAFSKRMAKASAMKTDTAFFGNLGKKPRM